MELYYDQTLLKMLELSGTGVLVVSEMEEMLSSLNGDFDEVRSEIGLQQKIMAAKSTLHALSQSLDAARKAMHKTKGWKEVFNEAYGAEYEDGFLTG